MGRTVLQTVTQKLALNKNWLQITDSRHLEYRNIMISRWWFDRSAQIWHRAKFFGLTNEIWHRIRFVDDRSNHHRNVAIFTGSIARSAKRRYLSYSYDIYFRFFAPQGKHVAPMKVKFGMEKWTSCQVQSSMANVTPSVQHWRYRTPKVTFYWNFAKSRNINAPQGHIPCGILMKFADFVLHFIMSGCVSF